MGIAVPGSVSDSDRVWMQRALALAEDAGASGEVPVGAVVVAAGGVIGQGANAPIAAHDASAHAEISALRAAGAASGNYRLPGCTLYVTLEPCLMCAGAIVHARIQRLVFGADDPRAGAVHSMARLLESPWLNHRVVWQAGVEAGACAELLTAFFRQRR